MTTTAYYRTLARDLEARLDWDRASDAWDKAIELYPSRFKDSAIGKLDIGKMAARREACLEMYHAEANEAAAASLLELSK